MMHNLSNGLLLKAEVNYIYILTIGPVECIGEHACHVSTNIIIVISAQQICDLKTDMERLKNELGLSVHLAGECFLKHKLKNTLLISNMSPL